MSALGDARQRMQFWRRAAIWPGRALHGLARLALFLLVLVLISAGGLAWRLSQGPLDITWLARRLQSSLLADGQAHLAIGSATIAWGGFRGGRAHGLDMRLNDLRLLDRGSGPVARVDQAEMTLSLPRMLELQVAPRRLALDGVRLRAKRQADGAIVLDLAGLGDAADGDAQAASLSEILAELRRPATGDHAGGTGKLQVLSQLEQVTIRNAHLEWDDATGQTARIELASLDLARQQTGGVKGAAKGTVRYGDATADLALSADLLPGGGTHVDATLAPTQTEALANASPSMAALGTLDTSLHGHATLDLSPQLKPRAASLLLNAGAGSLSALGGSTRFDRLAVDARAQWSGASLIPDSLDLQHATVVLPSPRGDPSTTVVVSGHAMRANGTLTSTVQVTLDHLAFADLPAVWPEAWGGNVRPWIAANVTGGQARDGAFSLTFAAPEANPASVDLVQASGTLRGDDVTIHWLRPVPPIVHGQVAMTFLNPDVIEMTVSGGQQGGLSLKDGLIRFSGLAATEQIMALTTTIVGPAADVLAILRHPRLRLEEHQPLPVKTAGGTVNAKLNVELPLKKELDFDQVNVGATGHLASFKLAGILAGRDLERGEIDFTVSQDGLSASGTASVAGIQGQVEVGMDFRAGPPSQTVSTAAFKGRAAIVGTSVAGTDLSGVLTGGQADLAAKYSARRDGTSTVEAGADLTAAGLSLLGWRKAPGAPAHVSATLDLRQEKLVAVERIRADGPGLLIRGRAAMSDGKPTLLALEQIEIGPTRATGDIRFSQPGGQVQIRLSGPMLDLSTEFGPKPARTSSETGPFVADLRFDRVVLAHQVALTGVSAHADYAGGRLAALQASVGGPKPAQATIAPSGAGRRVSIRAADGGLLLRGLDILDTIGGGDLTVDAMYDDRAAEPPLSGTVDLQNFSVYDAVIVGKLLQAITLYGLADVFRSDGVHFARLVLPFRYDRRQFHLGEAQAYSSSLGLTATGWVDEPRKLMDIRGTVVPAYALNSALGRLPLVGRLFSPERGGGLIAVNYAITGSSTNPKITVNPLSAFTPGFLRRLFNLLG